MTPSAVQKLAAHESTIAGLLNSGIIYIDASGAVHSKTNSFHDPMGFKPKKIGFLANGDVYVSGQNVIGIYTNLPTKMEPKLYAPTDCDVIFER